ncbi:GPI transamidase component PIG-S-like isoform X2 [Dysidea avara]|uniref:GPI transamidase component PIG-S-like isoform X2 n=1 Tax=Dysidea avara TaxID=196820 RepID=UPI0033278819
MLLEKSAVVEQKKLLAALSVGVLAVFVVLPLWWKTTEVYRATLPYKEIEQLSNRENVITITRQIVVAMLLEDDAKRDDLFLAKIQEYLRITEQVVRDNRYVTLRYIIKKQADGATLNFLMESIKTAQTIKEASDVVGSLLDSQTGHFCLVLFPQSLNSNLFNSVEPRVFVSKHRIALVQLSSVSEDDTALITRTLDVVYGGTDLQSVLSESLHLQNKETVNVDRMRQLRPSAGVQLSFTLLNTDPYILSSHWNIEDAIDGWLRPFMAHRGIRYLCSFYIESQVLYYTDLELNPVKRNGLYTISAENLPQALSILESRMGFQVSQLPNLNFVVYVSPINKTPLYLYHPPDWQHGYTSLFSPQWGGLVVYNHDSSNGSDHHDVLVDMHRVMPTFITQLKKLLGLPELERDSVDILIEEVPEHGVLNWQTDRMLEAKMVECVSFTLTTLQSLLRLLDEVKNMVISDKIQQEVMHSMGKLIKSKEHSSDGKLDLAFQLAKQSMHSAEMAFFDPSILALLYFPDDQNVKKMLKQKKRNKSQTAIVELLYCMMDHIKLIKA